MKDLRLNEIWIYPIKSLGGVSLPSAKVMEKGLLNDRRWMLVDEHGKFLTQRVHHIMALFKLALREDHLLITFKNDSIKLLFDHSVILKPLSVTIWDDTVAAYEVNEEYSNWFSEFLGLKCKLVYFPEENKRAVDARYKINDENVSLADAYPFLVIGQSSLDDLNARLEDPVSINRFRPNFVFTGGDPYEEDRWRNFSIGSNHFVGVKLCARCVLTTVNQETAQKGAEPLKTLASYRTKNNKVLFGQNLVALNHTEIKVGDKISIESYQ